MTVKTTFRGGDGADDFNPMINPRAALRSGPMDPRQRTFPQMQAQAYADKKEKKSEWSQPS